MRKHCFATTEVIIQIYHKNKHSFSTSVRGHIHMLSKLFRLSTTISNKETLHTKLFPHDIFWPLTILNHCVCTIFFHNVHKLFHCKFIQMVKPIKSHRVHSLTVTVATNLMTIRTNRASANTCLFYLFSILLHSLFKRCNISITHFIVHKVII